MYCFQGRSVFFVLGNSNNYIGLWIVIFILVKGVWFFNIDRDIVVFKEIMGVKGGI